MNLEFRDAKTTDKEFILESNREINVLSGLSDSTFEKNIDNDLFQNPSCKVIIAEVDGTPVGLALYSYIYWANCGKGIYLSQIYVKSEFRNQGLMKKLLLELRDRELDCKFITNLVGNENVVMLKTMDKLNFKYSDLTTYYIKMNDILN